ncbi:MBL fold metallo-hydrolase [Sorangium sp. So ce131]|uniref:MBL fold metallo-hydrolase n=1 Tax=Sorangium sp. So ce131 TaxID=3133282 RepID=UPI003F5F6D77
MPYLRSSLVVQPLFQRWYAWSHLVSPATACMNVKGRHLKIMESFIKAPMIHAMACRDPKMLGGPFMDIDVKQVGRIRELYEQTRVEAARMLEFAAAVESLNTLITHEAKGHSIEPLYNRVPALLKGYVELTYDLNHQPGYRLVEPLLYHSELYRPDLQSVALSIVDSDDRPFVLSTPVLDGATSVHLPIPFADPRLDQLFKMKREPHPLSRIRDLLEIPHEKIALFETFFTDRPMPGRERYHGAGARVRYFGHACMLIETRGVSILIDPVVSYDYRAEVERFTDADLPETIDYVLITHNHQDHVLIESLLKLRHKIGTIVVPASKRTTLQDPSLKLMLRQIGFTSILELDELDALQAGDVEILGIPFLGEHCDLEIQTKLAYLVRTADRSLLFAADACNISPELYGHVQRICGDIDVLFLGMECDGAPLSWIYGALYTEEIPRALDASRRLRGCNFERARRLVETFHFKEAYVYAMGMEPWLKYIMAYSYTPESDPIVASDKLIAWCQKQKIDARRLYGKHEFHFEGRSTEVRADA